jgi:hypothetical protein
MCSINPNSPNLSNSVLLLITNIFFAKVVL